MDADGANKTPLGLPIGDAILSMAKRDGMRWFLHAYFDLHVTNEVNETITLYSPLEDIYISQVRWKAASEDEAALGICLSNKSAG